MNLLFPLSVVFSLVFLFLSILCLFMFKGKTAVKGFWIFIAGALICAVLAYFSNLK